MKAVAYTKSLAITDPDALRDIDLPAPEPGPHDLQVAVHAIAVNPVDTKIRRKVEPEGTPKVLGWDAVGIVRKVGPAVSLFKTGDRVWYAGSLTRPGANSELHLVDERIAGHAPQSLTDAEAAALPLTTLTAWELLFERLGVPPGKQAGDAIMIVGAAGGVGSILVQLAARLTGLNVIGSASRAETRDWVKRLGAHHVIDHTKPLSQELARIGVPQVRYVAALNQTDLHYDEIIASLAPQGKLALIDDPAGLDVLKLKRKAISLHWEFMFTRSMFETPDMIAQHRILNEVAALVDAGIIRSTLAEHFGKINASNLQRAHQLLESTLARGKIVLEGWD